METEPLPALITPEKKKAKNRKRNSHAASRLLKRVKSTVVTDPAVNDVAFHMVECVIDALRDTASVCRIKDKRETIMGRHMWAAIAILFPDVVPEIKRPKNDKRKKAIKQ
jgi:hypothetical protein